MEDNILTSGSTIQTLPHAYGTGSTLGTVRNDYWKYEKRRAQELLQAQVAFPPFNPLSGIPGMDTTKPYIVFVGPSFTTHETEEAAVEFASERANATSSTIFIAKLHQKVAPKRDVVVTQL